MQVGCQHARASVQAEADWSSSTEDVRPTAGFKAQFLLTTVAHHANITAELHSGSDRVRECMAVRPRGFGFPAIIASKRSAKYSKQRQFQRTQLAFGHSGVSASTFDFGKMIAIPGSLALVRAVRSNSVLSEFRVAFAFGTPAIRVHIQRLSGL